MKEKICFILIAFLSLMMVTCSQHSFSPLDPDDSSALRSGYLDRLAEGQGTLSDAQIAIQRFKESKDNTKKAVTENPDAVIVLPETGQLLITLRDSHSSWQESFYMTTGDETTMLIEDTRDGPLNTTTEFTYEAGNEIGFYLTSHAEGYLITNNAKANTCIVEEFPDENRWLLSFENIPDGPEWDYDDVIIEIRLINTPFVDYAGVVDVNIDYLNPHGFNADGYAIYYIGETMYYNTLIDVLTDDPVFHERNFTVYVVHEYFDTITCDRWWYPSPPRPADEPQTISVQKGDPLPNQNPPTSWPGVTLSAAQQTVLSGSYTSDLSIAAGNDQTHVVIVSENEDGEVELTVFDDPEAGVFDPPPAQ